MSLWEMEGLVEPVSVGSTPSGVVSSTTTPENRARLAEQGAHGAAASGSGPLGIKAI